MRTLALSLIIAVIVAALLPAGCQKNDSAAAETTTVKPMEEYREGAAKEINKDNVEDELAKLKKEIEADKSSE